MTTVEILRAAKARIDTPEKWCGDDPGGLVDDRVCSVRAIGVALGYDGRATYRSAREHPAVDALARAMGVPRPYLPAGAVVTWNDSHTHAEVMAAFDRAIANEEARSQEFTAEPVEVVA